MPDVPGMIRAYHGGWGQGTFLARLSHDDRVALVEAGVVVEFGRGEVLVAEGDEGTDVFLLLSSTVKVTARTDSDRSMLLAVRTGGDVIGELAMLEGVRRTATVWVRGREPVRAVRIEGPRFLDALRALPDAHVRLTTAVARKLRAATRRRAGIAGWATEVRLAQVITDMADDYGVRGKPGGDGAIIGVDLTQDEWGALIGVSESTAYRALSRLKERRLVSVGYRRIEVPDVEKLRAYGSRQP